MGFFPRSAGASRLERFGRVEEHANRNRQSRRNLHQGLDGQVLPTLLDEPDVLRGHVADPLRQVLLGEAESAAQFGDLATRSTRRARRRAPSA